MRWRYRRGRAWRLAEQNLGEERREGDGEVREKSCEIKHFQVLTNPEQAGLAPTWAVGVARDERK